MASGNFSRDPDARLRDAVAKHYVGVRMQQGVPLLDADWNELEDLRRHELQSLVQQFIGDGVPDGNDGFRIEAIAGGGVGTIVLRSAHVGIGPSSLEIVFAGSTAASVLGFLPGRSSTARTGSSPAQLTGNAAEPFPLLDGMTLTVAADGGPGETVVFAAADFADIGQATALEVVTALDAGLAAATAQVGSGNDFIVTGGGGTAATGGRLLVGGKEILNESDLTYGSQPLFENASLAADWGTDVVPALQTPAVERRDVVYVDVFERLVDQQEDAAIMHPLVGVPTAVRSRREWAVRVAEGADDLSAITRLPGHVYLSLARLVRTIAAGARITPEAIVDVRRQQLNLAKYLKTPIKVRRGATLVDAERYAAAMDTLKEILGLRLNQRVFPFSYLDDYDRSLVQIAVQGLMQQGAYASVQARTGNFSNQDGLHFLQVLYSSQHDFVTVVDTYGDDAGTAQAFVNGYNLRLEGSPPDSIPGLRPALQAADLVAAVIAQEQLNAWLGAPVDVLPEGSVVVSISEVSPTTPLALNVPLNVTYEIESRLTSTHAREKYDIGIETAAAATWDVALDRLEVELDSFGGRDTVVVTLTPRAGTLSVNLRLTATARRNSTVTLTHQSGTFSVGAPPPAEEFFQWVSPAVDASGRVAIPQADFADNTFMYQLNLINRSDTDEETFAVVTFVEPPPGPPEWHPVEAEATPVEITLPAGQQQTDNFSLFGPVNPALGTTGTLVSRATLVRVNGVAVVGGKTAELEQEFIIVA